MDVLVVGSATCDIFLKSSQFPLEVKNVGGKIEVEEALISSGGGGSNVAVGLARLGISTACVARFGDDIFGDVVLKDLKKENFDRQYLLRKAGDNTDMSVILVNPEGARTILVHRGRTRIEKADFPWEALKKTKWLYFASLEGNVDLLIEVINRAYKEGVKIVLNPGNRELTQKEKLIEHLSLLTALVLNTEEADQLGISQKPGQSEILVITDGRQGACLYSQEICLQASSFQGSVVDETGAGDAFSAGFLAGLVKGVYLAGALKMGMANGASVVSRIGAKAAMLMEKEMAVWLEKDLQIKKI